jgi:ribosomal protein S18 acetylase RimI-like enzyme
VCIHKEGSLKSAKVKGNGKPMIQGIVGKQGLNESDLAHIRELAEKCKLQDGFEVKLNWGLIDHRPPNQINDFCYYHQGNLVGYVPLDGFGDEYEVTGLVLPSYRRQGIFRQLLTSAHLEAFQRGAKQLLLVCYPAFPAEKTVAEAFEGKYFFSEYHLEVAVNELPIEWTAGGLRLAQVKQEECGELSRLLSLSFGAEKWSSEEKLRQNLEEAGSHYFFAKLGEETIGQIGVITEGKGIYIRGVGLVPTYRGKGYGRQLLATTLKQMFAEGYRHFELDVVTANRQALSLYQVCGFRETNVYNYYLLSNLGRAH